MIQLAIRCHPYVPLSAHELEPWLEQQVNHFRAEAPHGTIRLWRLTQELPSAEVAAAFSTAVAAGEEFR